MTRFEKYTQIKQLNHSLPSTEQKNLIKEIHRDCDNYKTLTDIKDIIMIGLMGLPLLLSLYGSWVDKNEIKFSDYASNLNNIMFFDILYIIIFGITST